jgi:hypothetical protein
VQPAKGHSTEKRRASNVKKVKKQGGHYTKKEYVI